MRRGGRDRLVKSVCWCARRKSKPRRYASACLGCLASTPLFVALFLCSILWSVPTFAQSSIHINQEVINVTETNSDNINTPGADVDVEESNAVPNVIDVENSDPLTEFFTAINVDHVNQSNNANVIAQSATVNQLNTVDSNIALTNSGDVWNNNTGIFAAINVSHINQSNSSNVTAQSATVNQLNAVNSNIAIANSGDVWGGNIGISAAINVSHINNQSNSSTVNAQSATVNQLNTVNSNIAIANSGDVWGGNVGILAKNISPGSASTTIINTGNISAGSLLAIDTVGASTSITNSKGGIITGFVDLTDNRDTFNNGTGALFEARGTSDFRGGFDVFNNGVRCTPLDKRHSLIWRSSTIRA